MYPTLYTFNRYCREHYGRRLVKVVLDAGAPCPHREGPEGGCNFCDPGAYTPVSRGPLPLREQLEQGIAVMGRRYQAEAFAAYFQSNTNTALPLERLREMLETAAAHTDIKMIFLATRPDWLQEAVLELLAEYGRRLPLWVELGIQSLHDDTLLRINRGHDARCALEACARLHMTALPVVAHMILGLPGETAAMMKQSLRGLADAGIAGIKLHHLQVHRDTRLAAMYAEGAVTVFELEEYLRLLCELVPWLPPRAVIFRLFAEARDDRLIAPRWELPKATVIDLIHKKLEAEGVRQGSAYTDSAEGEV